MTCVECQFFVDARRYSMKHFGRLLMAGTAALLALSLVVPAVAQDTPAPGEGGIIITRAMLVVILPH